MTKRILVSLFLVVSIGCSASTKVAVDAEKNIHTSLGLFRGEMKSKCESPALAIPCKTVNTAWLELLDVAIQYDEVLLSEKVNQEVITNFQRELSEFVSVLKSVKFDDLTPQIVSIQSKVK